MPGAPNQEQQLTLDELRSLIANVRTLIAEVALVVCELDTLVAQVSRSAKTYDPILPL